jgi:hypothetical protein
VAQQEAVSRFPGFPKCFVGAVFGGLLKTRRSGWQAEDRAPSQTGYSAISSRRPRYLENSQKF